MKIAVLQFCLVGRHHGNPALSDAYLSRAHSLTRLLFFLFYQREIAEEKERTRKIKEEERLAKLEIKRLEKEVRDRERAELQARDQARREIEREKARLAKRYPLPDEVRAF